MDALLPLLSIVAAIAVGAASPGPSFVLVARIAVADRRASGLAAAFGMGIGGVIFASLALAGLIALLTQIEWFYLILRIAGAAYLLYLAWRLWRGAGQPLPVAPAEARPRSLGQAFMLGLVTQLSNPKTAVVYAGIFAALLPAAPPLWLALVLPFLIFCVECGWYSIVATVFSSARPRAAYLRGKGWIDRLAGGVMGLLGLRLIAGSLRG